METTQQPETGTFGFEPVAIARLCAGLLQAIFLFLLPISHVLHLWPATQPAVFAAIFMVAVFVPLIVVQAAGQLPSRRLALWAAGAAAMAAIIGSHDMLRRAPQPAPGVREGIETLLPFPTGAFFAAGLFIAHALIVAAAVDRRRIAGYVTYFDVAWKQCVQAVAAAAFTAVFWIVLSLGAGLFDLIKLDFLSRLIKNAWFGYPATAMAFAVAIHVTDVRPQVIRSIKTLMLTLLSWLLPLAALIAAVFLLSLPMTGLAPLWATKSATPILLGCTAGLIVLLNAAYQDGAPERAVAMPMRVTGTIAALLLFPMVAIAGYGMALRVGQYGWTKDRIVAAACVLVGACYAAGYLWAAWQRRAWLRPIETCNIFTSFVVLGVIAALLTPVADPARLATASQLVRLKSGVAAPEQFDFIALRFDNDRYGYDAVNQLLAEASDPKDAVLKAEAERVVAMKFKQNRRRVLDSAAIAARLTVSPPGSRLPETFLKQDWNAVDGLAPCASQPDGQDCSAVLLDLDGDGVEEVVLIEGKGPSAARVFAAQSGAWRVIGNLRRGVGCPQFGSSLGEGPFTTAPARWRDIVIGDARFTFAPIAAPCTP